MPPSQSPASSSIIHETAKPSVHAADTASQRSFGERRASYRLFPSVDLIPPQSPVVLQRTILQIEQAACNHCRRSSSLDHQALAHSLRYFSASRLREHPGTRKQSLPDICCSAKKDLTSDGVFGHEQALSTAPEATASSWRPSGSRANSTTVESRTKSINSVNQGQTDEVLPEPLSKGSLALAAARANVAAPLSSNTLIGSPSSSPWSKSFGSDIGILNTAVSDALPRRPSTPDALDPVAILRIISDEVDALHTLYASLKIQRRLISTSIAANLKDANLGTESTSTILDLQLSLATVSSSLDICFAQLKSLDCRKEDAIAALIARTTRSQDEPDG